MVRAVPAGVGVRRAADAGILRHRSQRLGILLAESDLPLPAVPRPVSGRGGGGRHGQSPVRRRRAAPAHRLERDQGPVRPGLPASRLAGGFGPQYLRGSADGFDRRDARRYLHLPRWSHDPAVHRTGAMELAEQTHEDRERAARSAPRAHSVLRRAVHLSAFHRRQSFRGYQPPPSASSRPPDYSPLPLSVSDEWHRGDNF
mmetsp:Transcript_22055/g.63231  ORF Transcript_22055/g.63231 Transcript_22055/m.63231 type:complete len:201 (-) Transcript_22055:2572-3174(-)